MAAGWLGSGSQEGRGTDADARGHGAVGTGAGAAWRHRHGGRILDRGAVGRFWVRASTGDFFFFSSRRRHTRLTCDRSSDVCSSDLLLDGAVTLNDIAVAHGVSVRTVNRVFNVTGQTVGEVIRVRRLARAREDLTDSNLPVSTIAQDRKSVV